MAYKRIFTAQSGRPKYMLPQEQLEFLAEWRLSVPQISKLRILGVTVLERWKDACPSMGLAFDITTSTK